MRFEQMRLQRSHSHRKLISNNDFTLRCQFRDDSLFYGRMFHVYTETMDRLFFQLLPGFRDLKNNTQREAKRDIVMHTPNSFGQFLFPSATLTPPSYIISSCLICHPRARFLVRHLDMFQKKAQPPPHRSASIRIKTESLRKTNSAE
mmetsp:Transcript_13445/g.24341  ORF Transcript_13445/g.24341 Transcript_13445/m.24341 type:complete len:147 (+) Transcript_13445:902-1342(+)